MLTAHLYQKLSALIPEDEKFAIAFSGGGDSTALVHALKDHPQARHIYIVDHDLRTGSNAESQAAKRFAITCGYDAKVLKWKHNSPKTAIQEKARSARYGLMGDQCRKDGIKYLLTAHSQDDQAETLLMRYDRKTDWRGAAGMTELSYSPVWPELAMVTVMRPMLDISRSVLRAYNREHDLNWAEDPSNQNRDFARIRARDYLKTRPDLKADLLATASDMRACLMQESHLLRTQFSTICEIDSNGIITLTDIPMPELMFHILRCGGGQGGMIDRVKIRRLLVQMRTGSFKSATLGGALVARHETGFVICRDPVAVKGRQDSHHHREEMRYSLGIRLNDSPQIWDGRFLVTGPVHRNFMGSVHEDSELLTKAHKDILRTIPAPARATIPVSKHENSVRLLGAGGQGIRVTKSLVKMRLEAALGGKIS